MNSKLQRICLGLLSEQSEAVFFICCALHTEAHALAATEGIFHVPSHSVTSCAR